VIPLERLPVGAARLAACAAGPVAPPLRSQATVPVPAPHSVCLGLHLQPARQSPEDDPWTFAGCFVGRVAPLDPYGFHRTPLTSTPTLGVPLPGVSTPTACYRHPGPAYQERTDSSPNRSALRSRPDPLSRARPFASADFQPTAPVIPLAACAGASSLLRPVCRLRGLVINL
jgi:hypothetical protein